MCCSVNNTLHYTHKVYDVFMFEKVKKINNNQSKNRYKSIQCKGEDDEQYSIYRI
jgi:hypothetical protein